MKPRIAGVDGCRAGWVSAIAPAGDLGQAEIRVFAHFGDLVDQGPWAAIAVDMPIGLPSRVGAGGREAERAVRPLLGPRKSSLFSVPARKAVYADDYFVACQQAAAHSEPPRKVSKQCFHIFPKIREVDGLLRDRPELVNRVYEVHPELAFWRLNGRTPLLWPKKEKGRAHVEGLEQRRRLLGSAGIAPGVLKATPPRGAATDDVLDALAGLVIAQRLVQGRAEPFPNPPARDEFGLPIAIWA